MKWLLGGILLLGLLTRHVAAHDARPLVVEVTQHQQQVRLDVTIPPVMPVEAMPLVHLSGNCREVRQGDMQLKAGKFGYSRWLNCDAAIDGQRLTLTYPAFNPSLSALVKVSLDNGQRITRLLAPDELVWQIPDAETAEGVSWQYFQLGMLHIWEGWDHLLFVVCLIFLSGLSKRLIWTVTGFTLGHSITLVSASMGLVPVPVAVFETLIALSIVFLAVELIRRDPQSWTVRYPMAVTIVFGLLHGLGFASVLQDIGLPQVEVLWGLVSFNLGIEFGQLSFIALCLLLFRLITTCFSAPHRLRLASISCIYLIGSLASFWFWERSISIFSL